MIQLSPECRKSDIAAKKRALRAFMTARRGELSDESRRIMSEAVAARVLSLPEVIDARLIALYIPIPAYSEVSTLPLLDAFTLQGKRIAVPVVQEQDLCSAVYRKGESLKAAAFGQPEPSEVVKADEQILDVVLLPLLAFDRRGYRLGYGKGFYDRYLYRLAQEGIRPFCIGVAFSLQLIDALPLEPWDEPLDCVVHEKGVFRFT
ncbi:MAG: 5-formyltetrahydrofolate cyclo-ligase [Chlorobiaceae bacterium]|nr:5-formyltetrahydrofolate cyclo-ligase [Chlorobiaceae bacterium]